MITFTDAKKYLDIGWPVFPVILSWDSEKKKYNKKPGVEWKKYQTELPTEEQLHKWFDKPVYNALGLATGKLSSVDVVDVGKGIDPGFDSKMVSRTISGGKHYYCLSTGEIRNTVKIKNLDFDIRGEGGFVVLPPSSLGDNKYEWEKECPLFLLEPMPEDIKKESPIINSFDISTTLGQEIGSRDDRIKSAIMSLCWKYPKETVLEIARGINATYKPPLEDNLIIEKVERTFEKVQREKVERNSGTTGNSPYTKGAGVSPRSEVIPFEPKRITDLDTDKETVHWLWDGYVASGVITLLSAYPKVGKSTLVGQVLKSMQEESLLAGRPCHSGNILILSEERQGAWANRRDKLSLRSDIWVISRPLRSRLNYQGWVDFLAEVGKFCKEKEINLLIIDTLSAFWGVEDENDASRVGASLFPLNYILDAGTGLLLIHHMRKSGGAEGNAARGSSALTAYVDIIVEFSRLPGDDEDTKRTLTTLSRFDDSPPETVIDLQDGQYITFGNKSDANKIVRTSRVIQMIKQLDNQATNKEIFDKWNDDELNERPDFRSIQRYTKEALENGKLYVVRNTTTPTGGKIPVYGVVERSDTQDPIVYRNISVAPVPEEEKQARSELKDSQERDDKDKKCEHEKKYLKADEKDVWCTKCGVIWKNQRKHFTILNS